MRRFLSTALLPALVALVAAGCGAKSESPAAEPERSEATVAAAPVDAKTDALRAELDQELIERFAGTYTRESYGHRVMLVRPDGTATMTVDVDPFYRWMTGPKITVEIAWELTEAPGDSRRGVHFASVSGTPQSSFEAVTKLFGTEADWLIESADDEKLVLYDPSDDETVVWFRVIDAGRVKAEAAGGTLPAP